MSDVDVLVQFDPDASITLWDYVAVKRRVSSMLSAAARQIDVVDLDGMNVRVRPAVERDALYAF